MDLARLDAQRSRLKRGPGMTVDDRDAHAAPNQSIGERQPGRASADDQDIGVYSRGASWRQ
jgi:hypothetical protein